MVSIINIKLLSLILWRVLVVSAISCVAISQLVLKNTPFFIPRLTLLEYLIIKELSSRADYSPERCLEGWPIAQYFL